MFLRFVGPSSQYNIITFSMLGIQILVEVVIARVSLEEYLRFFIKHLCVRSVSRHVFEEGYVVFDFAFCIRFPDIG